MICDGSSDCVDGDDEEGCGDFVCSGALRCRLDNNVIICVNLGCLFIYHALM